MAAIGQQPPLTDEEWNVIRDYREDDESNSQSEYVAKAVSDVSKKFIEDDVVLIKENKQYGGERTHILPQEVIKETARRL